MDQQWQRAAERVLEQEQILCNEPMSKHTTFAIGGAADLFLNPRIDQLAPLLDSLQEDAVPYMILGKGSDLLVGDRGIRGAVIHLGEAMEAMSYEGEHLHAEAGALLSDLADLALEAGLTGMEPLSGIPGSLGGAVMMNAGAYGACMADVIESVCMLTPDGQVRDYSLEEMHFAYRHSRVLEEQGIVLSATLRLRADDPKQIAARMEDFSQQRQSKQPLEMASAGSMFKRPEGYFAGKLIQDSGLRGYRVGNAQVSEKHSGFVVNLGGASAAEVRQLIADIQARVKEKFGVDLETEVRFVGDF